MDILKELDKLRAKQTRNQQAADDARREIATKAQQAIDAGLLTVRRFGEWLSPDAGYPSQIASNMLAQYRKSAPIDGEAGES